MTQLGRFSFTRRIAPIALFAATCNAQTGTPASWGAIIQSSDLFVKAGAVQKNAPQSIFLIGENHASVKTQEQLADLLQALYREHSVDAILVEGSNGKIDASDLRGSLSRFGGKSTAEFWKGQLGVGQIAGYEYIALTRDGVRIQGVEDMDAKRRYTADAAKRGAIAGLKETADRHARAAGLAKDALIGLDSGARRTSGIEAAVVSYEAKIAEFRNAATRKGPGYAEAEASYSDSIERITALFTKVRAVLPAYDELAKQYKPYETLLAKAKAISDGGSVAPGTDTAKLLSDLRAAKGRVEVASAAFDTACRKAGYANGEAAVSDLSKLSEIEAGLKTAEAQLTSVGGEFVRLETGLTNQFYLVANAVRTASGKPQPALQSFLRDELERARANANDPEKPFLSDRDKYMVANTMAYLRANPSVGNVALIIGYAHLEGMTKRLTAENVNLLTGKVAASEEPTEAWENRAWERRSRPAVAIFSHAGRKEVSRLLDDTYKTEIPALVAQLQSLTVAGSGIPMGRARIFEVPAGSGVGTVGRKSIVTTGMDNLRANWGSQVVHMGTAPDGKATAYLIFDRDAAKGEAKTYTDGNTMFAAMYRTKTPQGTVTKLDTATGTIGLDAFQRSVPRQGQKVPRRVVLAPEGDDAVFNTALASGGHNDGEPPWTSRRSSFAEPPDGKRPSIFLTRNMRTASERLQAIDKQDPLKIGQIAAIDMGSGSGRGNGGGGELDNLWFTPDSGDHARAFFILGDNNPEFRAKLKAAADAGLLKNKQIALATCFDTKESDGLHEMLLEAGALMVWSPQKRVSPQAAAKLQGFMEKVDSQPGTPARGLDEYMDRALRLWHDTDQTDPDLEQFLDATNRAMLDGRGGPDETAD